MKLAERCHGRWRNILTALGVESKFLSGKHGPCPWCGGVDRYRFTDWERRGYWYCNQCGVGDGIEFVKRMVGGDFKTAAKLIETVVETATVYKPKPYDEARRRGELNAIWGGGVPITATCPAGRYLAARGLPPPLTCTALRWSEDLKAMIAKVTGADGVPVTVQQTFINGDAEKVTRKTFWGKHPIGSAVRLMDVADTIGIAEGVETAMSASILFAVPVWAALDANHLAKWVPPAGIKRVMIFGDSDRSYTGQAATYALAQTLRAADLDVSVHVPVVGDWNDELRRSRDG